MDMIIGRNHNSYGEIMSGVSVRSENSWACSVLHKSPSHKGELLLHFCSAGRSC